MATLWERVKNVFDDHQERDFNNEIAWTQEQSYLKGATERVAFGWEESPQGDPVGPALSLIAEHLKGDALAVREVWRNDRLWNDGQREEYMQGQSRGFEQSIERLSKEADLLNVSLPDLGEARNLKEQVDRAVEIIELSGRKGELSREGGAGAKLGFSRQEQDFAADYKRLGIAPETAREVSGTLLNYDYRSPADQELTNWQVTDILAKDLQSPRHLEAQRQADNILRYEFRTPEARERIDHAMDSERAHLRDNGMDPVESWTAAAKNLARRLDPEGYERNIEDQRGRDPITREPLARTRQEHETQLAISSAISHDLIRDAEHHGYREYPKLERPARTTSAQEREIEF